MRISIVKAIATLKFTRYSVFSITKQSLTFPHTSTNRASNHKIQKVKYYKLSTTTPPQIRHPTTPINMQKPIPIPHPPIPLPRSNLITLHKQFPQRLNPNPLRR